MTTIQRIGVMSISTISLILGGIIGLAIGGIYFRIVLLGGAL
jgi:hypothetical protein